MKQDNWKKQYRLPYQPLIALGLLAASIWCFALLLQHDLTIAALLGGFPAILGSIFYLFSDKWGFLRWTALISLLFSGLYAIFALEGIWFSVAILTIGISAIIGSSVSEFLSYCHSRNYKSYFSKKRRSLWSILCYPVRRGKAPEHLAESDQDSIIAQTTQGKPVQLIPGKQALYVHYLETSTDGREILPESRMTEYRYVDNMQKKTKHDYRIHYNTIQNAECWCMRFSESPCEGSFTVTGILKVRQKRDVKHFYLADDSPEVKIQRLLAPIKKLKFHRERPAESTSAWERFRKVDKHRKAWLVLRSLCWLTMLLSISGIAVNFAMQRIFMTAAIACILCCFLFFCLFSGKFTIRDSNRHGETSLYSRTPNISGTLLMTSCILALIGLMIADIQEFGIYALISLAAALCLSGILILCAAPDDRRKSILTAVMISIFFSFGAVACINYLYDPHEPSVHSSQVYDMHTSTSYKSGTSYYLEVEMENGEHNDISVSASFYQETAVGDTVLVCEYEGLFGIAYATLRRE